MRRRSSRAPRAYLGFFPTPNGSLTLSLVGQYASDVLLASDLFAIGGYGSVRGFQPGTEAAERGVQGSVQYNRRFALGARYRLVASIFYDVATLSEELAGTIVDDTLESAGVGLGLSTPSARTRIQMDWARPLGEYDHPDIDEDDDTWYLRVTQDF